MVDWLNSSMFPSGKIKKKIESAIFDLSSSKIDAKGAFCFHYKKGASLRK